MGNNDDPLNRFSWLDYFWAKVEEGPDCWIWKGSKTRNGYGKYTVIAHKIAYELAKGRVPDGLDILHSCDNPLCVNLNIFEQGLQRKT